LAHRLILLLRGSWVAFGNVEPPLPTDFSSEVGAPLLHLHGPYR
jgi:hypothetical protein